MQKRYCREQLFMDNYRQRSARDETFLANESVYELVDGTMKCWKTRWHVFR